MRAMVRYEWGGFLVRTGGRLAKLSRWCHRHGTDMQVEVIRMAGRKHS